MPNASIDISTSQSNKFLIWPNPFSDAINFDLKTAGNSQVDGSLTITNMEGKILYSDPTYCVSEKPNLDLDFLPSGVYILKFIAQGNCFNQKISKL